MSKTFRPTPSRSRQSTGRSPFRPDHGADGHSHGWLGGASVAGCRNNELL